MKKYLIATSIFFTFLTFEAKSQKYTIDTLSSEYQELTSYNSIFIEFLGRLNWDKRFELPFLFPYFGYEYNYINCDHTSTCYFDNSIDVDILLMSFSYDYDPTFEGSILSDVRYNYFNTEEQGRAFVLQYTNNRLFSDTSVLTHNSYINFQLWFYESGIIEVHFGDINLDHSPNYVPGEGFFIIFSDGTKRNLGPSMLIRHPYIEGVEYGLDGEWNNYMTEYGGYLTTMPPKGFIIRFIPETVKTKDEHAASLKLFPNPATDMITIANLDAPAKVDIYNLCGALVSTYDNVTSEVHIGQLPAGMYIFDINNRYVSEKHKVIRLE